MRSGQLLFLSFYLVLLVNQSCTMVKITASEKRNPIPQQVVIDDNTRLTTWGAIRVNKSHFFPSSFQLKADGKVIYIDPVEVGDAEPADLILITHAHPDHLSLKDIKSLIKDDTRIICSKGAFRKLKNITNEIQILRPTETLEFEGLNIQAISAYNTRFVFLWIQAHPRSKENLGYVISLKNGTKVYHAGDTDYIPEMKQLYDINIALVPIGGDNLTMNEEEAAKIINEVQPKIAIPMHYEIEKKTKLERFEALVNKTINVIKMQ